MKPSALAIVWCLALGTALPAVAQDPPTQSESEIEKPAAPAKPDDAVVRIGVLDVRTRTGSSNEVTAALRDALAEGLSKYRVQVVEDHPAVVAAHGQGAEARYKLGLQKATKYLRAGEAAYKKFDSKTAEKRLRRAADLYEQSAAGMRGPDELTQTYLLMARVFFATNREMLARDIFKRLVQLQPDLSLDVASYPPAMIKTFDSVKREVLSSPLGTLSVTSKPKGFVYLDAQKRGEAPQELINLPAGVHLLVVRRTGYAPFVQRVDVTSFRQEKVEAILALDRHPQLHLVVAPDSYSELQRTNPGLSAYLRSLAKEARLDLVAVATAAPAEGGLKLVARMYAPDGDALTPPREFKIDPSPPKSLDAVAQALLTDAAESQLIPALAARRNVRSGGGALDETRAWRGHAAFVPTVNVATTSSRNFPAIPGAGLRVGLVRRITGRLVVSAETGADSVIEPKMTLRDETGAVIADKVDGVNGIFTSIPVEVSGRYYIGVRTLAPYVAIGGGVSWDMLFFQEQLDFDEIAAPGGLGWRAYAATGADWALSTDAGLFGELRVSYGQVGVGDAALDVINTPQNPDGELPIEAGDPLGFRLVLGYLRVF